MFFFAFCFERYILKLAATDGGVVVSNDNYRDLINESPEFKEVIEKRLLMFSFVPGAAGKPDRCVSLPRLFPNSHTPPSPASACLNLKLKTSPSCIISCGYFYLKFLKTWVLSHECKLQTKRGWLVRFHNNYVVFLSCVIRTVYIRFVVCETGSYVYSVYSHHEISNYQQVDYCQCCMLMCVCYC